MPWGTTTIPTVRPAITSPVSQPKSEEAVRPDEQRELDMAILTVPGKPVDDGEQAKEIVDSLQLRVSIKRWRISRMLTRCPGSLVYCLAQSLLETTGTISSG